MNPLWMASEFLPTQVNFHGRSLKQHMPVVAYLEKQEEGNENSAAAELPRHGCGCHVGSPPSLHFSVRVCGRAYAWLCWDFAALLLPSRCLGGWPAVDHTCSRSSVAPSPRWVWTVVYSGHRSGLGERSRCLCLCFLPGNCLGLVCPSAGHFSSQGSLQSCFCPWSVASSGLSSWSLSLTPSSVNSPVSVLFEHAICFQ